MAENKLITITGNAGAGKSVLAQKLHAEYGFEIRNIGDELARLYRLAHGLSADTTVQGLERMKVHKEVRERDPKYFSRFILGDTCERRLVDGLRNYRDACDFIAHGGIVISLAAPRPVRFLRRLEADLNKDPDLYSLLQREMQELNDSDPDGAQTLRVMALAATNGFFVDATQPPETVFNEVVERLDLKQPASVQQM
jgi:hypothetical protein